MLIKPELPPPICLSLSIGEGRSFAGATKTLTLVNLCVLCVLVVEKREPLRHEGREGGTKGMQGALPERTEQVAKAVVDAAFKVHSKLGPGLLESVYQACMVHELKQKGLFVEAEQPQPIIYEDIQIGSAFRLDLVVERFVIVELKAVEVILPVHRAQLLT